MASLMERQPCGQTRRLVRYHMVERRSTDAAPTRELLTYFDELHKEHLGERAIFNGGKDAKTVAELFHSHGAERVKELMRLFFETESDFVQQAGYTVGVFKSQAAKLMAQNRKQPKRAPVDWWDECKTHHGGSCISRYTHGLKMQDTKAS